jgi:hypothetical protein
MPEFRVGEGPRWIALAAAVLAVLAALCGLLSNLRVTQSTMAKSDAIIHTAQASDTYGEYESRSIKQHVYEAAVAAGARDPAKLQAIAQHESAGKEPLLKKAKALQEEALHDTERAEHLLHAHEVLEVATTLFEVAIVMVSIAALVGTRLLPLVAAIATGSGLIVGLYGMLS